jgi:glycopeptide antibiotics resistance protein
MRKNLLWTVFACYVLILLRVVLFKYSFAIPDDRPYLDMLADRAARGNYVPFSTISTYAAGLPTWRVGMRNILGNILVFVPLGALAPCCWAWA